MHMTGKRYNYNIRPLIFDRLVKVCRTFFPAGLMIRSNALTPCATLGIKRLSSASC